MRISRHQMFMEIAHVVAKRGTCFRESVGCIIAHDKKVVSIGYNGAPEGQEHCLHHPQGKCSRSIHAEINALRYVDENNKYQARSCDLYVTHLPCEECAKAILRSSLVGRVFFSIMYGDPSIIYTRFDEAPLMPIQLFRVLPSGVITSWDREEILDV